MQFLVKLLIALGIIIICSQIGGRLPKLAGLIATMPFTGLVVLIWLYHDGLSGVQNLSEHTRGASTRSWPRGSVPFAGNGSADCSKATIETQHEGTDETCRV